MKIGDLDYATIDNAIKDANGNCSEAARTLGVTRASLWRWRKQVGYDLGREALSPESLASVKRGIEQADRGELHDGPDLDEIATIRKLERSDAKCRDDLRLEKAKRKHAEAELHELRSLYEAGIEAAAKAPTNQPIPPAKKPSKRGSATAIICATDWHAEENVDPSIIDNANEFNLDICRRRVSRLWEKSLYLLEFSRGISNVTDGILWLGGDLVNGVIHEELEEGNFLGPSEAVIFIQDLVAEGIDRILKQAKFSSLTVVTNQGNHGRSTRKKRISTGYRHSWEYLAYNNLARLYQKDKRVRFQIAKGYHNTIDVQGSAVRFHHGDSIKYAGGVGGLTVPARKKIAQWNKRATADLDIFGHFHQFIDMWDFFSCGCLVGYNGYALEIAADYQPPTQGYLVIDKRYGKVMALPVFVEEVP